MVKILITFFIIFAAAFTMLKSWEKSGSSYRRNTIQNITFATIISVITILTMTLIVLIF